MRPLLSLAAATLTALGCLSVPTPPARASATVSQSFSVPAGGRFTVLGHGFGHGHGMSQYGADGAAARGLPHERILGFYYPGTTISRASGFMRVRLTGATSPMVLDAQRGLEVGDTGTHRWAALGSSGISQWRAGVSGTRTVLDYRTATGWHRWRALTGDAVVRSSTGTVALRTRAGRQVYRDRLVAASPRPGSSSRVVVNILPLESYVRGVVAREMPAGWHAEAVQSQAVAARTYAVWARSARADGRAYSDICDTTSCQVYAGVAGEHPLADAAVRATAGQVLSYRGKPAFTQFSASSGGWTSAGGAAYLPARQDPYDGVPRSSVHTWSQRVDARTLQRRYPAVGTLRRVVVTRRQGPVAGGPQWGGRAERLTLVGSRGSVSLSGDTLRSVLGLRSTWVWFRA